MRGSTWGNFRIGVVGRASVLPEALNVTGKETCHLNFIYIILHGNPAVAGPGAGGDQAAAGEG